ncbi:MAG: hypothetical protein R3B40_31645 [Polyangiales bacterium]
MDVQFQRQVSAEGAQLTEARLLRCAFTDHSFRGVRLGRPSSSSAS